MPLRTQRKLMKTTWYPQPHRINGSVGFELDDETLNSTYIPFCFYDEGKGTPTAVETNPRNAAFARVEDEANCHVNSRINNILAEFRFSLTSFVADQNIQSVRFAVMPVYLAFAEDYTAINELNSLEIQDILHLQTESTDRQGGPLYVATTDLPTKAAGLETLGANTPFLNIDVGLEAVAFAVDAYYNALHFHTTGAKLAKVTGGLRWQVLTHNRPTMKMRFNLSPKVKRMNEFTYGGLLVHFPIGGDQDQTFAAAEIAGSQIMVNMDWNIRYNEWNEDFNSRML